MVKKIMSIALLTTTFISSSYGATITYSSNYGLENILFTIYLLFNLGLWYYIYRQTKPVKINENNLLSTSMNATFRFLSYAWFFIIVYMSKGIILISSSAEYLDDKLFVFNLGYYITFFLVGIFVLLVLIKHGSKISGLTDFIERFIYELKNE